MPSSLPTLLAVAHGTQDPAGIAVLEQLADRVRAALPGVEVRLCYVDVASPSLGEAVRGLTRPAVLVPWLLSTGYHVKTDIPRLAGHLPDVLITQPIGPDPRLSLAALTRLAEAGGWRPGSSSDADELIVVSAGSSDPAARAELALVAEQLHDVSGLRVRHAQLTEPDPFAGVAPTTPVVNYLLAPGFFASKLASLAVPRLVGAPIGAHPLVVEVVADRYRDAAGRFGW